MFAGMASFSLEVAWTRYFALLLGSSTYSFAVMLAAFIAGIALGSAVVARRGARLAAPLVTFGWVQVAAGAIILVLLPLYPYLPWPVLRMSVLLAAEGPGAFYLHETARLLLCALVMLPATTLLGMSIPLMLRAIRRGSGRSTGQVYAWNTLGNVAGALVAGLFLLPLLGMEALLRACGAATVATGVAALLAFGDPGPARARRLGGAGLVLVAALAVLAAVGPWDLTWFTLYPSRREADRSLADTRRVLAVRDVVLFRDDPAANVLVMAGHAADRIHYSLLVNGKPDASTGTDMPTQILLGHLPMLLHPRPSRALIVGFASGITAGAVLKHDLERLDVVDIVGTMREASGFFRAWNGDPLSDPRLHFIVDDARAYIARTGARYDVVIAEPSNPWVAGTGALFATEFYQRAAACLAPGGIYLQWIQAYELSDDTLGAILRSFRRAFPHALAFQAAPQDLLLVGTGEPFRPDWPSLGARFARPAVTEQLATIGIRSPAALLLLERISGGTIDWLAAAAERENTDDNLLLEHHGPRDLFALAQPEMLGRLDERLFGGPGLLLTRYLREAGQALDPRALAAALDDGLVSGVVA
jgi:spermidine synthase